MLAALASEQAGEGLAQIGQALRRLGLRFGQLPLDVRRRQRLAGSQVPARRLVQPALPALRVAAGQFGKVRAARSGASRARA